MELLAPIAVVECTNSDHVSFGEKKSAVEQLKPLRLGWRAVVGGGEKGLSRYGVMI